MIKYDLGLCEHTTHISGNEEFNRYTAYYILFNDDYGDSWCMCTGEIQVT